MTENPYDSPSPVEEPATVESDHTPTARPIGVSILAVLHFVGGIVLFGAQFQMLANLGAIEQSLRLIGVSMALLIFAVMFLAVLTIASGVGMWMGTKWGWWLASFYYAYSILRNGSALITAMMMADQLEDASRGPEYYLTKHGVRIALHFLLFLYFFQGNVLRYFGLATLHKAKAIGVLVGICIAITVVMSAIGLVLS